jgi:hypothetical protein
MCRCGNSVRAAERDMRDTHPLRLSHERLDNNEICTLNHDVNDLKHRFVGDPDQLADSVEHGIIDAAASVNRCDEDLSDTVLDLDNYRPVGLYDSDAFDRCATFIVNAEKLGWNRMKVHVRQERVEALAQSGAFA